MKVKFQNRMNNYHQLILKENIIYLNKIMSLLKEKVNHLNLYTNKYHLDLSTTQSF